MSLQYGSGCVLIQQCESTMFSDLLWCAVVWREMATTPRPTTKEQMSKWFLTDTFLQHCETWHCPYLNAIRLPGSSHTHKAVVTHYPSLKQIPLCIPICDLASSTCACGLTSTIFDETKISQTPPTQCQKNVPKSGLLRGHCPPSSSLSGAFGGSKTMSVHYRHLRDPGEEAQMRGNCGDSRIHFHMCTLGA